MILSKRMNMNVSLVPPCDRLLDVGCDHCNSGIYLVQTRRVSRVLASDNKEGPLKSALENITKAGLQDRIQTVLSDGLQEIEVLPEDVLFMTGMGGPLMIRLLEDAKEKLPLLKAMVLQPQSHIGEVRRYVEAQGFRIQDERGCKEEGKLYFSFAAFGKEEGRCVRSSLEYAYGPILLQTGNEAMLERMNRDLNKKRRIWAQLPAVGYEKERDLLRMEIGELEDYLNSSQ